ncbi:fungal-specific transcription factor domain-containing protein [Xylogone sp. PMI_703]|nr:fungal-specific transcription factor domain-containing protein [Xylogone sp. PMI_703]
MSARKPKDGSRDKPAKDHDSDSTPDAPVTKRKRKRVHLACKTCRARKQRCDGLQPKCTHCNLQRLDCSYEAASQKAEVSQLYVHNLLMRIEQLEKDLSSSKASVASDQGSPSGLELSTMLSSSNNSILQRPSMLLQDHGSLTATPASMSAESPPDPSHRKTWSQKKLEENQSSTTNTHSPPSRVEPLVHGYLGEVSNITFLHTLIKDDKSNPQEEDNESPTLNEKITDNNISSNSQDSDAWPQRHIADHLVECFMELCYPQYQFIYGPAFRKRYESIWASKEPQSNAWIATVNTVFALGCQYSTKVSPEMGHEFFKRAKSFIDFDLLGSSNLETLQALILMSLYLQSSASLDTSWNVIALAIRMAQSLGLHLRKTYKPTWSPLSHEIRKRAWWGCYVLDSVAGIMLGRPNMIPDHLFNSVDFPERIDDEFFLNANSFTPASSIPKETNSNQISELDFFIYTIHLGRFMREISSAYDNPFDHPKMLDIDDRLCQWMAQAPPHLQRDSKIPLNKKLWRQKVLMTSRFLNLRIVLHRACVSQEPFIKNDFGPFDPIRDAGNARLMSLRAELCTMAAVKIIQHISSFYADGLGSAWWYDLNHIFSASSVIVSQILRGRNVEYHTGILKLAIDVIRGMYESGKQLAGQYLRMLEKLQQAPINLDKGSNTQGTQHHSDPPCSILSASTNTTGHSEDTTLNTFGIDMQNGLVQGDLVGNPSFSSIEGTNEVGEYDVNSLMESLSFPWNLQYQNMLTEEDYASLLFGDVSRIQ